MVIDDSAWRQLLLEDPNDRTFVAALGAPFPISFEMMLTFAASSAPVLWLLGAVMMLKRQPPGFFIASMRRDIRRTREAPRDASAW
jgi:hypothetical protein